MAEVCEALIPGSRVLHMFQKGAAHFDRGFCSEVPGICGCGYFDASTARTCETLFKWACKSGSPVVLIVFALATLFAKRRWTDLRENIVVGFFSLVPLNWHMIDASIVVPMVVAYVFVLLWLARDKEKIADVLQSKETVQRLTQSVVDEMRREYIVRKQDYAQPRPCLAPAPTVTVIEDPDLDFPPPRTRSRTKKSVY
jgi:hypothetical protein